jgi:hypothetical protein
MMGRFLMQHEGKMKGLIPVYYDIFFFHAFKKYSLIK